MFAIQFTRLAPIRAGADRNDCHWFTCMQTYVSLQEAEQEAVWMAETDPHFEYRVVPLFDGVPANDNAFSDPPANDNGETE